MKGKRKKGESTSSETPEKKKASGGRLSGMLESMEKRGSPVNAHRVATAYFESFRKDRNIPKEPVEEEPRVNETTAVDTGVDAEGESAVVTAVGSAVKRIAGERKSPRAAAKTVPKDWDPLLAPSEMKVYEAIYKVSEGSETEGVRIGLKELRELTGLSDKTVRMAVHSLTEKLNVEVVEKALGVYGRKYKVYGPEEVHKRRREGGLEVDPVTKKVLVRAKPDATAVSSPVGIPVDNAVSTAVSNAVDTTVITAVGNAVRSSEKRAAEIEAVFERYAGRLKEGEDVSFSEKYAGVDVGVIEAAVILSALKGKGGIVSVEDVEHELGRLGGGPLPAGYLEGLREVWESLNRAGGPG
ncbi:MAG TPA: hypothetical protein PKC29_14940 [Thermodesulfobacteriota bacterium]|nr:hypothetical protein [Thermodesulfobacteriota bacterium]